MKLLFGAIADDVTGGADLAGMLAQGSVRTVQTFGVPTPDLLDSIAGRYQAVVVCLKSRSIPAAAARRVSLEALESLLRLEPAQIQFKYCSTFDSTPEGNIGPVTDVLMERMGEGFTIAVPALPVNGRTQYLGHLFVNGQLLSDSPMRDHPLNPMTDSNLVRWLQRQTWRKVGLIALPELASFRNKVKELRAAGFEIALVDVVRPGDLERIAEAVWDWRLLTGGSGLGVSLPTVWRQRGLLAAGGAQAAASPGGKVVVLSGSCSSATLRQLDILRSTGCPVLGVGDNEAALLLDARERLATDGRVVIASSAAPENRTPGAERSIEELMGRLAQHFVQVAGVRRFVIAGGETSGAVVEALGVKAVEITGILDPGVPSLRAIGEPDISLTLKSGNFGSDDFFVKAMERI